MRLMGLRSVAPRPFTSRRAPGHVVYPYLLGDIQITRVNHAWCVDLTYIPMAHGFLYVMAIMDWHCRKVLVLAWRLSNTQDTAFCVEALEEAIERYGCPEIFNTDQGSQFTSTIWTSVLKHHGVRISMDGKGQWMDGQRIHRAPLALTEIRMRLPERLPGLQGIGFPYQGVDGLLQRPPAPFRSRRPHHRRGLRRDHAGAFGSIMNRGIHLRMAAALSNDWGPLLTPSRCRCLESPIAIRCNVGGSGYLRERPYAGKLHVTDL